MEGIIKQLHEAEQILKGHVALATPPGPELNEALQRVEDILEKATAMCRAARYVRGWSTPTLPSYQPMESD